jgi:hypothetical protein
MTIRERLSDKISLFSGAFLLRKKGGEFHQTYRPFTKRGSRNDPQKPIQLIIFFAAKLKDIFISHRLKTGRWPPGSSHIRQGHWLRALRRKAAAFLNNTWNQGLLKAFDYLIEQGHIPVSRCI